MKYCPKCKTEYEDWVKLCADCEMTLVNQLPKEAIEDMQMKKEVPDRIRVSILALSLPFMATIFFISYVFSISLYNASNSSIFYKNPLLIRLFFLIPASILIWKLSCLKNWARIIFMLSSILSAVIFLVDMLIACSFSRVSGGITILSMIISLMILLAPIFYLTRPKVRGQFK